MNWPIQGKYVEEKREWAESGDEEGDDWKQAELQRKHSMSQWTQQRAELECRKWSLQYFNFKNVEGKNPKMDITRHKIEKKKGDPTYGLQVFLRKIKKEKLSTH